MRPTIKDVAARSGFSTATVSLVLNGKDQHVAKATREKIITVAKEMNYRPNQMAVGLITRRTKILGMVLPDINNMFFVAFAMGVEEEVRKRGYLLFFANSSDLNPLDSEYISAFIDHGVDGIIYAKDPTDEEQIREYTQYINQTNIPAVSIDCPMAVNRTTTILMDQIKGARIATEHLLAYGHRRIGCLAGPPSITTSRERLEGYRLALENAGVAFDPELIYEGDFRMTSGEDALSYLLGKNVSAIFAFNDMMALGLYKTARSYRINIPRDLSVVGFDDNLYNDVLEVPLTTVSQPIHEMGRTAAAEMFKLIENPEPCNHRVVFDPVLKVRASTRRISPEG